ncbi:hypothetical protein BH24ACT3_BH24ACT3_19030 [soil metagenome]
MMAMRSVLALAVWSLLIWATRIDNIWSDEALDTLDKIGRTALALSFVAFAVAALVLVWRSRRTGFSPVARLPLVAFAAWTIGVWVVRGGGILVGDHDVAFQAVHSVLAVVSIALAVAVWRAVRGSGRRRRPRMTRARSAA